MNTRSETGFGWQPLRLVLVGAAILGHAAAASAGIHTWDVVEVFSNAAGTIQYVELLDLGTTGVEVGVGNGAISSAAHSFSWSNGPVTVPTDGKSYLIATAGFAALPGAPLPDVIIPAANVPFFDTAGDTITFTNGDAFAFGAVPTNGTDSLDEASGVGPNTPKNYAGVQGSVDAGAPTSLPSLSGRMLIPAVSLLAIAGIASLQHRRRAAVG